MNVNAAGSDHLPEIDLSTGNSRRPRGVENLINLFDGQGHHFLKCIPLDRKNVSNAGSEDIKSNIFQIIDSIRSTTDEREVFLSLASALHTAYQKGQLDNMLINEITNHVRSVYGKYSLIQSEEPTLNSVPFMFVKALKRIVDGDNFETFKKLISYFDGRPDKQLDFIYNAIVPPYQLHAEGSCFATAELIILWNNFPSKWMYFITGVIDFDQANFNVFRYEVNNPKLWKKDLIVDTSRYGYKDKDSPAQTYQKMVSGTASFANSFIDNIAIFFRLALFVLTNLKLILQIPNLSKIIRPHKDMVWSYGTWMPLMCLPKQIKDNTQMLGTSLSHINEASALCRFMYEIGYSKLKKSGGIEFLIINALSQHKVKNKTILLNPFRENSIVPISTMKKILKTSKNEKIKPGSLIPFSFSTMKSGHAASLIAVDYDADEVIDNMQIGEKIRFGLTNWHTGPNCIYMKKINEHDVQLVLNLYDTPDDEDIPLHKSPFLCFDIYPDFMVEAE